MDYFYDYGLVSLSFVLAVIAAFSALGLASRIPHISQEKVPGWLLGGAVAMGLGIWSMHFVGMLAFHLPIPLAYDFGITTLSVIIAIISSAFSLYLVRNGIRSEAGLLFSACLMGLGIAGMHYTGMAALKLSPPIDYDPLLVFASVLIAIFASLFAIRFSFSQTSGTPLLFSKRNLGAAVLMGVAIAGMHYTGMAAASFSPDSLCLASPKGIDTHSLALVIALTTTLILLSTLLMLSFDIRMAEQNAIMVQQLQRHNIELKQRAEEMAYSMTEQMRKSHARDRMLAAVVEQSEEALITTDLDNRITSWNQAATTMFGYNLEEAIGRDIAMLNPDGDSERCHIGLPEQMNRELRSFVHHKTKNGDTLYVNIHTTPLHNEENEATGTIHMLRDVTRRFNNHQQLVLWSSVFTNSGEGIIITDSNNKILSVNRAFSSITGYTEEEVQGKDPGLLASGQHDAEFYRDMWQALQNNGTWKGEMWNRRKNGEIYPEWLTITTLKGADGTICNHIASFSDATLYKEKEERIKYLAYHDKLTGLPNRSLLEDRLSQSIAHARRLKKKIAVLFLDLDRFKLINDTLGHHMGDKLLQETAQRLRRTVRSDDTVCRQGGDEFIVVVQDLGSVDDAAHIAQNVLTTLSAEFEVDSEKLKVTPSIGISIYPDDAEDIETLIKHADTAMYHAKEQGRSNYQFFTSALNDAIQEKMYLEKELSTAISRRQLALHYQPQIRLNDGRIIGAEVLLRWNHPTLGLVPPDKFIPIAEDSGLIDSIGQWVLHNTAIQIGEWLAQGIAVDELTIAVNISARQLEGSQLISCIEALFAQHPHMAGKLELEVTETALMRDVQQSVSQLNALKDFQLSIAVDDFGTGYSSLAYLKRLPIDTLKIDRTFIKDIPGDEDDAGITEAIIRLAQTLHLSVIAEGIETAAQESFLQHHRCGIGQGYLYSRPVPADEFALILQQNTLHLAQLPLK